MRSSAVGDAAVRRRAVAQRLEQEAEARLGLLGVDAERGEDLLLHVGVVDTDRAAAELLAVPDDVVGERPRRARVVGVELAGGRGERVVQRVPAPLASFHSSSGQSTIQTRSVSPSGIRSKRSARSSAQLAEDGVGDLAARRRRPAAGRPPRRRAAR